MCCEDYHLYPVLCCCKLTAQFCNINLHLIQKKKNITPSDSVQLIRCCACNISYHHSQGIQFMEQSSRSWCFCNIYLDVIYIMVHSTGLHHHNISRAHWVLHWQEYLIFSISWEGMSYFHILLVWSFHNQQYFMCWCLRRNLWMYENTY